MDEQTTSKRWKQLVLEDRHRGEGARFAPFAGYQMPIRFGSIFEEHEAVRTRAGIFDVSHMGEIFIRGERATEVVDRLVTNDIRSLAPGRATYAAICNEKGGIIDDVIVYKFGDDDLLLCVNAARRDADIEWIRDVVKNHAAVDDESEAWCQFAIQGPRARSIVDRCTDDDLMALHRFAFAQITLAGAPAIVARTGYTGEDGFEVFVAREDAATVYDALREAGQDEGLAPIGLGARDTLRLEAGLLLYGNDMDESVTPLEAGIGFAVKLDGEDFIGSEALHTQRSAGITRKIIGLRLGERGVLRGGEEVVADGAVVGRITSASVAPSLDRAMIAHAMVAVGVSEYPTLSIRSRDRELRADNVVRPFYRPPRASKA